MFPSEDNAFGFTGNQLKIIAMVAMTIDHIGLQLLPEVMFLRVIGRLAMPIYAFMIAEGCRHTRNRKKYLLRMAAMAAVCQVVYYVAMGSLYQCILVTFSLSICLIYGVDNFLKQRDIPSGLLALAAVSGVIVLCRVLPVTVRGFDIDYGIFGVLLPVLVYFGKPREPFLLMGLILLALDLGSVQWWALATVPLLWLYNGQRGKANIGKLFYFYYPLHLVAIHGLSLIL